MSREEDAYVIERMGKLLAEIAIIVNGTEPHDTLWSYHDLPEKVRALKQAQQPAALAVPDGYTSYGEFRWACDCDERMKREWTPLYAAPPAALAVPADGMLPDALVPHAKEWYRLCERRFSVDRITISGKLAEAIVAALAQQPAAAVPQSPSYDALLIIAQSVLGALLRAGVEECDDPGEAIDVLRERYERRIAELQAPPAAAVPEGYNEDEIADACMMAEVPDSKYEAIIAYLGDNRRAMLAAERKGES